ncbi:hypothetical protein OHB49_45395 (plasmid) [Streptomyces sp. NBC_01717]|uniref:hypothetical protein n=1 Tax=Streptomyces sp. NBC_01717 TaxID=2975918 RepID=UPI002E304781|nr:hypothetical protein [Streptomyces sp. NBC_01717]
MTARQAARRLITRTAPPVGLAGLALAAKTYADVSGWVALLITVVGVVIGALPALLPQESEHRRDAWRDWLRHRERMARLRIGVHAARSPAGRGNDRSG